MCGKELAVLLITDILSLVVVLYNNSSRIVLDFMDTEKNTILEILTGS